METQKTTVMSATCNGEPLPICNRPVTGHEINGLNRQIEILADAPGHGNASHRYMICAAEGTPYKEDGTRFYETIIFQNGPVQEAGINGVTNEALLAIVADRLRGFQDGPYKGRENAFALTKIEEALHWLNHRTQNRVAKGIEGTHKIEIEVGHVVRLNSGGPNMTVISVEHGFAHCSWIGDSGVLKHAFPLSCLTFLREK